MDKALAYINYGRFVVDCPHPGCTDAREVVPGQTEDACLHGHPFHIVMPPAQAAAQLLGVLSGRAHDGDKAWYPAGHVRAELAGQPTGQTVEQLQAESIEVARFRRDQDTERRERLAALLAEHGLEVLPDGTVQGRI